ncbi:MAG: tetratricopeptide repeat protein [Terriglobales bacterium]
MRTWMERSAGFAFMLLLAIALGATAPSAAPRPQAGATVAMTRIPGHFVPLHSEPLSPAVRAAAERGDPAAALAMAHAYLTGQGVARDVAQAVQWLDRAAAAGSADAMQDLGLLLSEGRGRPADLDAAFAWWQKSVAAGSTSAEAELGQAYLFGDGVEQDVTAGLQHLRLAAEAQVGRADFILGNLYAHGFGPVASDHARALSYFRAGAGLGDADCEAQLGWMYGTGFQLHHDRAQAVRWYRAAAEQGNAVGEYGLADHYAYGRGVPKDLPTAEHWYQLAADQGHADAAYNLALYLGHAVKGRPGPPDWEQAAKYFTEAAQQGIYDAQCMLGQLYAQGAGEPKDPVVALHWMLLSLEGSQRCAQREPGLAAALSAPERDRAQALAAAFQPVPHIFTYGRYADH